MRNNINALLEAIRKRYEELPDASSEQEQFVAHLHSLSRWHEEPDDYPEISGIDFPSKLTIAYAVCHPECGTREFIVDGNTQECQYCGSLLFRTEIAEYQLLNGL